MNWEFICDILPELFLLAIWRMGDEDVLQCQTNLKDRLFFICDIIAWTSHWVFPLFGLLVPSCLGLLLFVVVLLVGMPGRSGILNRGCLFHSSQWTVTDRVEITSLCFRTANLILKMINKNLYWMIFSAY